MARLTILQASQQGFGSTLTIHRHIKDGSLPTYEEGDTKLLDVDDLIALFGEPGGGAARAEASDAGPDRIDIYEYNRMKSELDQKNKKNMWLAADLAEVVREMKEKEAKFEAERDRLLKVLEQAQALLLREAQRAGSPLKNADGSVLTLDQVVSGMPADVGAAPIPEINPNETQSDDTGGDISPDKKSFTPESALEEILSQKDGDPLSVTPASAEKSGADNSAGNIFSNESSETSEIDIDTEEKTPGAIDNTEATSGEKAANTEPEELEPLNPLIPPLEAQRAEPDQNRFLGTTTWLLLLTLVGGGFVFFEFRTQVMTSISKIMKVLGGV